MKLTLVILFALCTVSAGCNSATSYNSSSQTNSSGSSSDSGKLTNEKAQRALDKFAQGQQGTVKLKGGIHEIPAQNTATAECTSNGVRYNVPGGNNIMPSDTDCTAYFTKYTDGRWVLTKVVIGYPSDARKWEPNIDVN